MLTDLSSMNIVLPQALSTFSESLPEFLQTLVDNVDDGIVVGDTNGRIVFSNGAATRINDDVAIPADPSERLRRLTLRVGGNEFPMESKDLPIFKVLREGEFRNHEIVLLSARGQKKILACNGTVLFDRHGQKIGALLVLHDQTLLRQVEQHERELAQERNDLLRVNAELQRFSSIAAHDLKSPLSAIMMSAELLRQEYGEKLGDDGLEVLDVMRNAGKRLRSLIDDLLQYARSGKAMGELSLLDSRVLVEEVLSTLLGSQRMATDIQMDSLPTVYANRMGLSQVFQNLISNALKFTSDRKPQIKISSKDQGAFTLFEVTDNGVGIRKEDLPVVFEVFKRVAGSEQKDGTGLGLPICKRIVELHGGSMWIESESGKGTSIFFTLPKRSDV
jgi:signal transduction histidine kinase